VSWSQPMCLRCWVDRHPDGRPPVTLVTPPPDRCAWCGRPTFAGIYVRADPSTLPYPSP